MEKSLNEETYEKLKYDIMNFRLLPGDSISAQKVALRYDVSRTPAREAIVNLEKEGLLKIIPHFRGGHRRHRGGRRPGGGRRFRHDGESGYQRCGSGDQ